ncbi:MAG: tRNA (adenosine(37)-N6)-threonylcarbamoyltransferase complex ATPase subunit type 1 TsaE [Gemmatimonadota bacterium]
MAPGSRVAPAAAVAEEETCRTASPEETGAVGARLAQRLRRGDVVAFSGDLGAGKTCMIQGLCAALQVTDTVNSPTFVLINHYRGRLPGEAGRERDGEVTVYHFDLYRLSGAEELLDLGAEEIFAAGGLCLVEWAERGAAVLPLPRWEVQLEHRGERQRQITCRRLAPAAGESFNVEARA